MRCVFTVFNYTTDASISKIPYNTLSGNFHTQMVSIQVQGVQKVQPQATAAVVNVCGKISQ